MTETDQSHGPNHEGDNTPPGAELSGRLEHRIHFRFSDSRLQDAAELVEVDFCAGHLERALELTDGLISQAGEILKPGDPQLAYPLIRKAELLDELARFDEAMVVFRDAGKLVPSEEITRESPANLIELRVRALSGMAHAGVWAGYGSSGAESWLQEAFSLASCAQEPSQRSVAFAYQAFGEFYVFTGNPLMSRTQLDSARKAYMELDETERPLLRYASCLDLLSEACALANLLDEARAHETEGLQIQRGLLAPSHLHTARSMYRKANLAGMIEGKPAMVKRYGDALQLLEEQVTKDHPDYLACLIGYAGALASAQEDAETQGDAPASVSAFEEPFALVEQAGDLIGSGKCVNWFMATAIKAAKAQILMACFANSGKAGWSSKVAEAIGLLEEVANRYASDYSPDHFVVGKIQHLRGARCFEKRDWTGAQELCGQAAAIAERTLGRTSEEWRSVMELLICATVNGGKLAEARRMAEQYLADVPHSKSVTSILQQLKQHSD